MSQLSTNSQLDMHVNNLGVIGPIGTTRGKWSYADEKTHYRDGSERKHPLDDEVLKKPYKSPVYYKPKFNDFVIDDKGRRYETFQVKTNPDGSIDFTKLDIEKLKIMFWYEHWRRKGVTDAYYRLKQNIEINKTANMIRNGGLNRNNYASSATDNRKTDPLIVTNGPVKPRQAQATRSGTAPPRKK